MMYFVAALSLFTEAAYGTAPHTVCTGLTKEIIKAMVLGSEDVGDCTATLAEGKSCEPKCKTGSTLAGKLTCTTAAISHIPVCGDSTVKKSMPTKYVQHALTIAVTVESTKAALVEATLCAGVREAVVTDLAVNSSTVTEMRNLATAAPEKKLRRLTAVTKTVTCYYYVATTDQAGIVAKIDADADAYTIAILALLKATKNTGWTAAVTTNELDLAKTLVTSPKKAWSFTATEPSTEPSSSASQLAMLVPALAALAWIL